MPQTVVDVLEVIEIDQQNGRHPLFGQHRRHDLGVFPPVAQTSELVVHISFGENLITPPELRHVVHRDDRSDCLAGLVVERTPGSSQTHRARTRGHHRELRLFDRLATQCPEQGHLLVGQGGHAVGSAQILLPFLHTCQVDIGVHQGRGVVEEGDPTLRIAGDNARVQVVDHGPQKLPFSAKVVGSGRDVVVEFGRYSSLVHDRKELPERDQNEQQHCQDDQRRGVHDRVRPAHTCQDCEEHHRGGDKTLEGCQAMGAESTQVADMRSDGDQEEGTGPADVENGPRLVLATRLEADIEAVDHREADEPASQRAPGSAALAGHAHRHRKCQGHHDKITEWVGQQHHPVTGAPWGSVNVDQDGCCGREQQGRRHDETVKPDPQTSDQGACDPGRAQQRRDRQDDIAQEAHVCHGRKGVVTGPGEPGVGPHPATGRPQPRRHSQKCPQALLGAGGGAGAGQAADPRHCREGDERQVAEVTPPGRGIGDREQDQE